MAKNYSESMMSAAIEQYEDLVKRNSEDLDAMPKAYEPNGVPDYMMSLEEAGIVSAQPSDAVEGERVTYNLTPFGHSVLYRIG